MIKHIGRHGERKIVVVFNTVPSEDHMALVAYSDSLPSMMHDEVMKVLESPAGQTAKDLAEALHRNIMPDGTNTLTSLHTGGYLKKVQTKQIILTPNAKTTVRLDELNKILAEMAQGQEAVKRMADIDAGRGFADPTKNSANTTSRDVGDPVIADKSAATSPAGVLTDADLAKINLDQARQLETQAKTLMAEARRLKAEAQQFMPAKPEPAVKKTVTKKAPAAATKKVSNVRATKKTTA